MMQPYGGLRPFDGANGRLGKHHALAGRQFDGEFAADPSPGQLTQHAAP
jgi:hypothetical protein